MIRRTLALLSVLTIASVAWCATAQAETTGPGTAPTLVHNANAELDLTVGATVTPDDCSIQVHMNPNGATIGAGSFSQWRQGAVVTGSYGNYTAVDHGTALTDWLPGHVVSAADYSALGVRSSVSGTPLAQPTGLICFVHVENAYGSDDFAYPHGVVLPEAPYWDYGQKKTMPSITPMRGRTQRLQCGPGAPSGVPTGRFYTMTLSSLLLGSGGAVNGEPQLVFTQTKATGVFTIPKLPLHGLHEGNVQRYRWLAACDVVAYNSTSYAFTNGTSVAGMPLDPSFVAGVPRLPWATSSKPSCQYHGWSGAGCTTGAGASNIALCSDSCLVTNVSGGESADRNVVAANCWSARELKALKRMASMYRTPIIRKYGARAC